jgi:hypothetical protein
VLGNDQKHATALATRFSLRASRWWAALHPPINEATGLTHDDMLPLAC